MINVLNELEALPYERKQLPKNASDSFLFTDVFKGMQMPRPPVWMMRQAGRYMFEYQEVRKKYSFIEICKIPEVAVEVTLQPLRAFGFDASIIFSDILIPLETMGLELEFTDAKGPQFNNPLRQPSDLTRFEVKDPYEQCGFLAEALRLMRRELQGTGIALIGFCGAPWTLATYAFEGKSWKTGQHTKPWLVSDADFLHGVLERITRMLIPYCAMQIEAGAQVIQVFDTWGGFCPQPYYAEFVEKYANQLINELKARYPEVPVIYFVKNSRGLWEELRSSPADALSVDDLMPMSKAREFFGPDRILQGNLDSSYLFLSDTDALIREVESVLRAGGDRNFIFNLSHGVLPGTPRENVRLVVETVQSWGQAR